MRGCYNPSYIPLVWNQQQKTPQPEERAMNPEHYDIVLKGRDAINEWREGNPRRSMGLA